MWWQLSMPVSCLNSHFNIKVNTTIWLRLIKNTLSIIISFERKENQFNKLWNNRFVEVILLMSDQSYDWLYWQYLNDRKPLLLSDASNVSYSKSERTFDWDTHTQHSNLLNLFFCVRVRCRRSVLIFWSKLWTRSWCQISGWVIEVCSLDICGFFDNLWAK